MLTVQILITLALGIFWWKAVSSSTTLAAADSITALALYALLFLIGIELGQNRQIWHQISTQGWRILLLPCAIATGTLAGAAWLAGCWRYLYVNLWRYPLVLAGIAWLV